MKKIKMIASSIILIANACFAKGGAGSHGGDMLISEFTGTARLMSHEFSREGNPTSCPNSDDFTKQIDSVTVGSELAVIVDGKPEDADNNQEKQTITISRSRMINASDDLNYETVVLHEYYGVRGLEKTNDFHLSNACMQELQVRKVDFKSLRFRIDLLSGTIEKLVKGELKLDCEAAIFDLLEGKLKIKNENTSYKLLAKFTQIRLKDWIVKYDVNTGHTSVQAYARIRNNWSVNARTDTDPTQIPTNGFTIQYNGDDDITVLFVPNDSNHQPIPFSCSIFSLSSYGN